MSEAKIGIKIGSIEFTGEGSEEWLSKQLDKFIKNAEDLTRIAPSLMQGSGQNGDGSHKPANLSGHEDIASKPLATFLKSKGADTNQNMKFLATAVWLEAKGQSRLSTRDVGSALSKANQKRLGNASESLNRNVSKGYCEKEGGMFFVTDEGKTALGIN